MGGTFTGTKIISPTTAALSDLLPQLALIKDCPAPVKMQSLSKAAREFCRRSEIWTETLPDIPTVKGQVTYTVSNPYNGLADFLRALSVAWQTPTNFMNQAKWTFDTSNVLTLVDAPELDNIPLTLRMVFLPRVLCTSLPAVLLDRWQDGIVEGAKWMIKSQAGYPFTDPDGAKQAERLFRRAIGEAKKELITGMQNGEVPIIPLRFV